MYLENLVRPVEPGDGGGLYGRQDGQVRVEIVEIVQQRLHGEINVTSQEYFDCFRGGCWIAALPS